ncbi:MAG: YolD-like family protein [Bacilli bacterium]
MKNRGMMRWLAYKSLNQQADYLSEMAYERGKQTRPLHSNEEAEEINDLLMNYQGGSVLLRYYDDGYTQEITGRITKIDSICKSLTIANTKVAFRDIVELRNLNF